MSYPYNETYLEQIQKNKTECTKIKNAYGVLLNKYCKDNHLVDLNGVGVQKLFTILGEAIELEASAINGLSDNYHFMWDVLDALFGED